MHLDQSTLTAMGSFVAFCAGMTLLVAWTQNRKVAALAIWGASYVVIGAGILLLTLGAGLDAPLLTLLAACLLALGAGLAWKAARTLDGKPAPLTVALLGPTIVGLASFVPYLPELSSILSHSASGLYLSVAAASLWRGRKEQLPARLPIIVVMAVHAAVMFIGAFSALNGNVGHDGIPPVMSLFGFVHFETIIFVLTSAVFVLALVKERNEAASWMAAHIDPLTGIRNRAAFMESAERILQRYQRENTPVSVMMCDLDRFKSVNDNYGHAVGDAVIRKFCELTTGMLRPTDVFGRLGGEEFAVVLPCSSIEAACARAERIRAAFAEQCRFVDYHPVNATMSCGVAVSGNDATPDTLETLLADADAALYGAKAEGRNRVRSARRARPDPAPAFIRMA